MIDSDAIRELIKASFGGDRSAAGRYAAEQRWKGHQKKVAMLETNAYSHPWESGAIGRLRDRKSTRLNSSHKA